MITPTGREIQVLSLTSMDLTCGQIGLKLHISRAIVEKHQNNLLKKMNAANMAEAAATAIRSGWME